MSIQPCPSGTSSSPPRETPYLLAVPPHSRSPAPDSQASARCICLSRTFRGSGVSRWVPFRVWGRSQHHVLQVDSWGSVCQCFSTFLGLSTVHGVGRPRFVSPCVRAWTLGLSHELICAPAPTVGDRRSLSPLPRTRNRSSSERRAHLAVRGTSWR